MIWFVCIALVTIVDQSRSDIIGIDDPLQTPSYECTLRFKQFKCACHSMEKMMLFEEHSSTANVEKIEISNCNRLIFAQDAIRNKTNLKLIILRNISNLTLENFSIYRNEFKEARHLSVTIINSNLYNIPSFAFGGITQAIFTSVNIHSISPYAFDSIIKMSSIRFFGTNIDQIKGNAFRKISTNYLVLNGCNIGFLSTRAFSNINIKHTFFILYSNFTNVQFDGFDVYYSKHLNVTNSNFSHLDNRPFKIQTNSVLFENVSFYKTNGSIFAGIRGGTRKKHYPMLDFGLHSATFDCFDTPVLKINTNGFKINFENVELKKPINECV